MWVTVSIDDALLVRASELTGVSGRTRLLREGLETLIRIESTRRLAALGGSDSEASGAPRRRDDDARP